MIFRNRFDVAIECDALFRGCRGSLLNPFVRRVQRERADDQTQCCNKYFHLHSLLCGVLSANGFRVQVPVEFLRDLLVDNFGNRS
jgi:hypothetical protein